MSLRDEDVKAVLGGMLRREETWLRERLKANDKMIEAAANKLLQPWEKAGWKEPREPSIVERIAGLDDPEIAERCRVYDAWVAAGRPRPGLPPWAKQAVKNIPTDVTGHVPLMPPRGMGGIAFFRPRYGR